MIPGENGTILHAQLTFGNGMIMLASAARNDTEYARLVVPPETRGTVTQTVYVVVEDADAVYAQARQAGCEIVMALKDEDYGGRGFTCRDPEGHIWSFGTYDPAANR